MDADGNSIDKVDYFRVAQSFVIKYLMANKPVFIRQQKVVLSAKTSACTTPAVTFASIATPTRAEKL